jgi:glucose-1-phosphate cytidylyltransferase
MQVVILCGGQGTRIRDVADDIPKPMIPIGGQPILWHIMKGYAHHGYTDFILCLGYKSWIIKSYFLNYHLADSDLTLNLRNPGKVHIHSSHGKDDWHLTLAETGLDAMTGCRIKRIEKFVTGDHFMLTYGDGVGDVDIERLVAFHKQHGKIGTVTAVQPPNRFGEVELDGLHVADFMEKPLVSQGWISGGFFVFQRAIFDRLHDDPDLIFEYAPLKQLAGDRQLMAYQHQGFWQPMDNSRDYRHLNDLWAKGQAPWKTWEAASLRKAA